MFVKVCGLRTAETVDAAVHAGADAIGFVFAPGSVRHLMPEAAAPLVARIPDGVESVGVFRNQPADEVLSIARAAGIGTVQLHGDEPADHFDRITKAGFGAIRALSAASYTTSGHVGSERLLIDASTPGSGASFDPRDLPVLPSTFWLLAGGLRPENVREQVARFRPSGVDVSSGVECAPGVKDPDLIGAFVTAARL